MRHRAVSIGFGPKPDLPGRCVHSTLLESKSKGAPYDLAGQVDSLIRVEADPATAFQIVRDPVHHELREPQPDAASDDCDKAAMDCGMRPKRLLPRDAGNRRGTVLGSSKEGTLERIVGQGMRHDE